MKLDFTIYCAKLNQILAVQSKNKTTYFINNTFTFIKRFSYFLQYYRVYYVFYSDIYELFIIYLC